VFIAPVTFKLPVTSVLIVCLIVVPSSVVAEFPTVDALVNLTNVLLVPDTDTDVPLVPDEPLEPEVPAVPDEPELPLVPDEPEDPLLPLEPEDPLDPLEPDVAAVYDVPFIDNEPVILKLPVT
jgi:hypothetical protein